MTEKTTQDKKLYTWNWKDGGYNQCYAFSKAEARKMGNTMCAGLVINESTFRRVKDIKTFWDSYPIFD